MGGSAAPAHPRNLALSTAHDAGGAGRLAAPAGLGARLRALAGQRAATPLLIAAMVAVSLALRTGAMDAGYWIDEGLSIGIAGHPLSEIPGLLAQDGSPPLYYALLHLWMQVAGTGETATHALSLVFALAAVPAAWWAARTPFGARAALFCAGAAALTPFLTRYGQETRMYALLALLSLLATGAVLRALVLGRRGAAAAAAVVITLMLYTHNWALFFTAGVAAAAAALVAARRDTGERRRTAGRAALILAVPAALYAPWLPTLLSQARRTGAPWSDRPGLEGLVDGLEALLAGGTLVVALAGAAGLALLARRAGRREREAALAAGALAAVTLLAAWTASQIAPSWSPRYLAVLVGPILVLAAAALARAGWAGLAAAAAVTFVWVTGPMPSDDKGNARPLARALDRALGPGDLVILTQPEQVSVVAHYLGPEVRYASALGPVPDPRVMDWRDAVPRLAATDPARTLDALLASVPPGGRVALVRPRFEEPSSWRAPWTALVRRRSIEWLALAWQRPDLRALPFTTPGPRTGAALKATVFARLGRQA